MGKIHIQSLFIFLIAIVYSNLTLASCPNPNGMDYVGVPVQGPFTSCYSDASKCGGLKLFSFDPFDPDFNSTRIGKDNPNQGVSSKWDLIGMADKALNGGFYCVSHVNGQPDNRNRKDYICNVRAPKESLWVAAVAKRGFELRFRFSGDAKNGSCYCFLDDGYGNELAGSAARCSQFMPNYSENFKDKLAKVKAEHEKLLAQKIPKPAPKPLPTFTKPPKIQVGTDCEKYGLEQIGPANIQCHCPGTQTQVQASAAGKRRCDELANNNNNNNNNNRQDDPPTPPAPTITCDSLEMSAGSDASHCACNTGDDDDPEVIQVTNSDAGKQQCTQARAAEAESRRKHQQLVQSAARVQQCVTKYQSKAQECQANAEKAKQECDQRHKDTSDMQSRIEGIKSMYMADKAGSGSGAQQQCFAAAQIANVSGNTYSLLLEECSGPADQCKQDCSNSIVDDYNRECAPLAAVTDVEGPEAEQTSRQNAEAIQSGSNSISETLASGNELCDEAGKNKLDLNTSLEGTGKSFSDAVKCTCQLSVSAGGTGSNPCTTIPTVADCRSNPELQGCTVYPGIDVCTPGPNYNAVLCDCQISPKGVGCPGATGVTGTLVQFGPDIRKAVSRGISAFAGGGTGSSDGFSGVTSGAFGKGSGKIGELNGKGGGKGGDSEFDLSSGGGSGGGGAGGALSGTSGGGGTGGSGFGSNPDGEQAAVEEEDGGSGATGGIFSQAKNFMSNALGLGGNKNGKKDSNANSKTAAKKGKEFDADKFRPRLRGLAGGDSELGSKNMDIWKMMNLCTSGESCKSNVNGFITTP